jgi:hypothetical protein
LIFSNLNPLPLTFSKVIQYQNSIEPLFNLILDFERHKISGSNGCEFPNIQFPCPLIRNNIKQADLFNFICLTLTNSILNGVNLHMEPDGVGRNIKYRVNEFRKDAVTITSEMLERAALGSLIGSDISDKEKSLLTTVP